MEIEEKAFVLLSNKICDTCKYCVNFGNFSTRLMIGDKQYNPGHVCNYENIKIYRPKGMEFPMNKVVKEDDTCEKWEKK